MEASHQSVAESGLRWLATLVEERYTGQHVGADPVVIAELHRYAATKRVAHDNGGVGQLVEQRGESGGIVGRAPTRVGGRAGAKPGQVDA